jgi:16S rRNA (cytidine1402-2'-O)-methyltransferase
MAEAFGSQRRAAGLPGADQDLREVRRGTLADLVEWAQAGVRGEITVVVAGADAGDAPEVDDDELARRVGVRESAGEHRKEAIAAVAAEVGVPKRAVFDAVVAGKVGWLPLTRVIS